MESRASRFWSTEKVQVHYHFSRLLVIVGGAIAPVPPFGLVDTAEVTFRESESGEAEEDTEYLRVRVKPSLLT